MGGHPITGSNSLTWTKITLNTGTISYDSSLLLSWGPGKGYVSYLLRVTVELRLVLSFFLYGLPRSRNRIWDLFPCGWETSNFYISNLVVWFMSTARKKDYCVDVNHNDIGCISDLLLTAIMRLACLLTLLQLLDFECPKSLKFSTTAENNPHFFPANNNKE